MYCKNCNFIMKGIETKCPYCGTMFEKEKILDKHINLFNWFELTVRQLLFILSINLFVIFLIVDIILVNAYNITIHLTPWAFLAIFGILFLMSDIILNTNNKNRLLFLKSLTIFLIFSGLMMFSFRNQEIIEGMSNWVLLLGYYYPAVILTLYLSAIIEFIIIKRFNIFSTFFYVAILIGFSILLFILSFIPAIGIQPVMTARLFIYICFAISMLITVNYFLISIFKLCSRANAEE